MSTVREIPGGGPQGCHLGQLQCLSQSDDSDNFAPDDEMFKFIDDMSLLEILNLIPCGLSYYNFLEHVSSHSPVEGQFLDSQNCRSQQILDSIL